MNLKKLFVASALSAAAFCANATPVPLVDLTGELTIKMTGLTTETHLTADSNESTWGIGSIDLISSTNGGSWSRGSDGVYLYYMIYGISDQGYTGASPNINIFNTGATGGVADGKIHLDVYMSNTQISTVDSSYSASPGGRTGYDSYNLFSGLGPAWLKLEFSQDILADDPSTPWDERLTTLFQTASSTTLPATGAGAFYADVVGGTDAARWQTGTQADHDVYGIYTLGRNGINSFPLPSHGTCTAAQVNDNTCFAGYISDPIVGNRIPEPTSLALMGLGLAGLAGLRRRKQ